MRVARIAIALLGALCAVTGMARADGSTLSAMRAHLLARGATDVRELARAFLFEGQSTSYADRLERAGCVGYLALGLGEVRDVDLGLFTEGGQPIAEDVAIAPYAYARVCATPGLGVYVSASLYAGRGELVLVRVAAAPRELGPLPEQLPLAVTAGGRLEELRSVGAARDELSPVSVVLQEERAQAALGYVPAGAPNAFAVRAGLARGRVVLRGGRCFRVVVVVPFSRGVVVEIEGPEGVRRVGRGLGDERATLALCTRQDAVYSVAVQARSLRGVALLRAFEHREVELRHVRELGDALALAVAEAEHVASARGLHLAPVGNAWVEGSTPLTWPIRLGDRGCYALAAVSEAGAGAIDLRVIDPQGVVLAHNEGRRGLPMVFVCARTSRSVRLVLRARGPDLPVSVWLGRPRRQP